ncbi:MAG: glutamate--tRNA ligase [Candidatus Nealsonbacteria bacterium]
MISAENLKFKSPGEVRVRIAPSPTGSLHIGLARTALFNFIFAKQNKGSYVLRIEDTDKERSTLESEKDIIENFKWLGLDWSEGPDIGGKYGPYRQSERTDIYKKYLEQLLEEKKAYYCFCSEEELEAQRQYHMSLGEAPIYSGKCSSLDEETIKKNIVEGKKSVIRFRTPIKKITFDDIIRGKVEFETKLLGDMVIAKSLGYSLYNFTVSVDDHEMKISHVIGGEDHIANTPKQIIIQEALGFERPIYAHLPLILAPDKSKLSKRHGAISVDIFKKQGYLVESLINFMAFLGWNPGDEREIYSLPSLVKEFRIEKVQKGGAIFNLTKLNYLNGFYIRKKTPEKITEICIPFLISAGLLEKTNGVETYEKTEKIKIFEKEKFGYIIKDTGEGIALEKIRSIISLYQERLKNLSEIVELTDFFFKKELSFSKDLLKWKEMEEGDIKKSLETSEKVLSKIKDKDWNKEKIEEALIKESEKYSNRGELLWPLRAALSGKQSSASPFDILNILEKEKSLDRIKVAKKLL